MTSRHHCCRQETEPEDAADKPLKLIPELIYGAGRHSTGQDLQKKEEDAEEQEEEWRRLRWSVN